MQDLILIVGGNLGDRKKLLEEAVRHLSTCFELKKASAVYETAAWGGASQSPYLNQVLWMQTIKSPEEILNRTQTIEQALGRERKHKWADRTMDIDILFYGEEQLSTPRLTIPHPFIQDRRFVLIPLAEILPDFVHPALGKTVQTLLEDCRDDLEVSRFYE